ncbi:MAG: family transcriptional regulator, cyclic receptor protein, partial [Bradyrhizobium sp.]|nr:family transcriptional regulator, cyclic receptor protein [Bradyrhizobium sp.]
MTTQNTAPAFDPSSFLARVGEGRTLARHDRNNIVFAQGDPADAVFYIQEGNVKVSILSRSGKEAVLAILGAGDFFGEGCLNDQPLRIATITIMTKCLILRLDKAAMLRVLRDEPKFSELFIAYLLQRNTRIEEDLVDHLFNSSEKRLARILLLLANFGTEGNPESVVAPISQETLAEMIGTTRSRVNFFMNK